MYNANANAHQLRIANWIELPHQMEEMQCFRLQIQRTCTKELQITLYIVHCTYVWIWKYIHKYIHSIIVIWNHKNTPQIQAKTHSRQRNCHKWTCWGQLERTQEVPAHKHKPIISNSISYHNDMTSNTKIKASFWATNVLSCAAEWKTHSQVKEIFIIHMHKLSNPLRLHHPALHK